MKMKDILHELESSDDEIDSYSAPDPAQKNPNNDHKVNHIDLFLKNHSNKSSDKSVMFAKIVPKNISIK